jgi:hypothetical protein
MRLQLEILLRSIGFNTPPAYGGIVYLIYTGLIEGATINQSSTFQNRNDQKIVTKPKI